MIRYTNDGASVALYCDMVNIVMISLDNMAFIIDLIADRLAQLICTVLCSPFDPPGTCS